MRSPRPWILPTEPATRRSLLSAGVSDAMLRSQVVAGRLVRIRPGVFVAATHWPTSEAERHILIARAEQALHPDSVISHNSAAVVWELPSPGFEAWHEGPVHLTQVRGSRPHRPAAVHHLGPLPQSQLVRHAGGYLLTTPARTAVELAAGQPLPQALMILDAAARLACAGFVWQPRRRDYQNQRLVSAARNLLKDASTTVGRGILEPSIELVNPSRESAIESLSAGYFELAGLPRPRFQPPLRTSMGLIFSDFLWDDQRLIGESDGAIKYAAPQAHVAEKEREQALRDQGWRVVRWLGKEIMLRPEVVVDRVARALGVRSSRL